MLAASRSTRPGGRVLFLQVVEPGMYPPIIAAAHLMADAGFQVTVLASPSADSQLRMDDHPDITVHRIAQRPNYVVRKQDYLRYMAAARCLCVGSIGRVAGTFGGAAGRRTARISRTRQPWQSART